MSFTTRQFKPGSWEELLFDIYSGLAVGGTHCAWWFKDCFTALFLRPIDFVCKNIFGIDLGLGIESDKVNLNDGLKVVGVGYGRTGTYSLSLALDQLGYPTLHTQHLYENKEIIDMWLQNVFVPSIRNNEVTMGNPDFDIIAANGYQATMDFPTSLYFPEIMEKYPDCKFILTVRENSEVWFRSWDTLTKSIVQPLTVGVWMSHVYKLHVYSRWLFSVVNKDKSYLTVPFPPPNQNKERSIATYEAHNKKVRELIPSDRLLEYNVKEGWEPLCQFLDINDNNCPTSPFPKSNSARSLQVQAISSIIVTLSVSMTVIFTLFSYGFQKMTGKTVLQWLSLKMLAIMGALGEKQMKRRRKQS